MGSIVEPYRENLEQYNRNRPQDEWAYCGFGGPSQYVVGVPALLIGYSQEIKPNRPSQEEARVHMYTLLSDKVRLLRLDTNGFLFHPDNILLTVKRGKDH